MKRTSILGVALCFFIALSSCGEKAQEMKDAMDAVKNLSENADEMQKKNADVSKRREERKAKGDTLAIHYKELQAFLPASINGYTSEEPSGESINMAGASYSTAKRRYTSANGGEVEVEILDYNQNPGLYELVTAMWAMGFSTDNDNESTKTFDPKLPYSAGIEHLYKKDKRSELTYAIGGRFVINVKANNQTSNDFTKSVANSMRLNDLSAK